MKSLRQPQNRPAVPAPGQQLLQLGLDVDLHNVVMAARSDQSVIKLAQKFSRPQLVDWVKKDWARTWQN